MKFIEKIVSTPILILIIMLKDLYDVSICIINSKFNSMDYFDIVIKLFICICFIILARHYLRLKDKMLFLSEIMKIRLKNSITDDIESDKSFKKALYNTHLKAEYQEVLKYLANKYPDKTIKQIKNILKEIYN